MGIPRSYAWVEGQHCKSREYHSATPWNLKIKLLVLNTSYFWETKQNTTDKAWFSKAYYHPLAVYSGDVISLGLRFLIFVML